MTRSNTTQPTHELLDMIVEEVSDVDTAANRRNYLIIKRDDAESPVEVVRREDGSLTVCDPLQDEDTPIAKIAVALPSRVKPALLKTATEALERLTAVVDSIKDATETSESSETPTPDSLGREMNAVAQLLMRALERYPAPMSKRGGRLSRARREQLKNVIDLLSKLLAEVTPAKSAPSDAPPGTRSPRDPNRANVGAGNQPNDRTAADALSVLRDVPGMADVLKKLDEAVTRIAERSAVRIAEQSAVIDRQANEIHRLRKATSLPASRDVEASRPRRPSAPDDDGWPLDMNQPITRTSVDKEVSFFDLD